MRIPIGNFGNRVAGPQQAANIPAGSVVTGAGEALQNVGQQVGGIGQDLLATHEKAQALRFMTEAESDLGALQDDISRKLDAGELDPTKAEQTWIERSRELVNGRLGQVGPLQREVVGAQLGRSAAGMAGRVRDLAARRVQQNIGGELTALGVQLEREPDPQLASARFDQAVRAMGPQAGWSPAQIETNVNAFREKAYATQAYSLVNGARNSMAALNEVEKRLTSDEFSALDPQRRAVLLNTTAGYKSSLEQRAVAVAQRAEIAAAKRDRQAAATYQQAFNLATEGKKLDPQWVADAAQQVMGTPYEAAFRSAVDQAPAGTAFAMQPLSAQRAALDKIEADGNAMGWTPSRQEMRDKLAKSYQAAQQDYKADPLRAAVDRGVLPELAPLDMSGGVEGLAGGIADRLAQAQQVEVVTGRPVSPFTPDEAGQVATLLQALPVDQKATTLAELSNAVGPRTMGAIASQLDSKDRTLALAAAYGNQQLPAGGLVAERLLRGKQAIEDKRVPESDVSTWRKQAAEKVRGVYATPEMEDAVIDSIVLDMAAESARTGSRNLGNAMERVSANIIDFNGGRIPLPQGMTESQFERGLVAITPEDLAAQAPDGNVYVRGVPVPVADFVHGLPDAVLRHAGQGRYTVSAGTGLVLNQDGQPIIVGVGNGAR